MTSYYERTQRDSIIDGTIFDDVTHQFRGKSDITGLRELCKDYDVEDIYQMYMKRLRANLLVSFFLISISFTCGYCLLLLLASEARMEDIIIYLVCTALVVAVLYLNLRFDTVSSYSWILLTTTFVALTLMVAMDIGVPMINAFVHNEIYLPIFYGYTISCIYFYLPFLDFLCPFIFGVLVSICYLLVFTLVSYRMRADGSAELELEKIFSECIFMGCLNFLGLYIRVTTETVIRKTFINKRECVEENFLLLAAKGQERILLVSMIPEQIAEKMEEDIQMRLLHLNVVARRRRPSENFMHRKLFLETHEDVTILYADMVNFTYLSTTLNVTALVGTLHDLYVRFDDAALGFNVLRIQFLGDCYYCVANVSTPNVEHAVSCVKLGLQMIIELKKVGEERDLKLSMRIGVHSGRVLSGVIGTAKWQFDIYSRDVDIASRLESTGLPDRVHISDRTLEKLHNEFHYENGTEEAKSDALLQKHNIKTYLILPMKLVLPNIRSMSSHKFSLHQLSSHELVDARSMFSGDALQRMVDIEMGRESSTIPVETVQLRNILVGKFRNLTRFDKTERNFRTHFSWWFVCFKSWRWEYNYMIQPDTLFKQSVLFSFVLVCFTICLQAVNTPQTLEFWILVTVGMSAFSVLLFVLWYRKIWGFFNKKWYQTRPRNKIGRWLFLHSEYTESHIHFRLIVYITILLLQLSFTFMQMAITESVVLNLIITFAFSRITYILKLIIGHTVFIFYSVVILVGRDFIYERSLSSNNKFYPEYAHILVIFCALILLNMITRQNEFISRVGYYWKRELRRNQNDAKLTNNTITRLISNILPSHIVDIYMDNQLSNELYHEEYTNVAVMFATILNFDIETSGLRMLNEIISDFDEVLNIFRGVKKVEKIKVAGWTYMAACGLNTTGSGHRGSTTKTNSSFSLSSKWRKRKMMAKLKRVSEQMVEYTSYTPRPSIPTLSRRRSVKMYNDEEEPTNDDDVVYVMARFASELLRSMKQFNNQNLYADTENQLSCSLRIGIASGPVMAGVVGLYKPHYDIWGNTVNMASRMDSTGVANLIQVTEEVANILEYRRVQCSYRGITSVKGRGDIPTYFIDLDEQLSFKKTRESGVSNDLSI